MNLWGVCYLKILKCTSCSRGHERERERERGERERERERERGERERERERERESTCNNLGPRSDIQMPI